MSKKPLAASSPVAPADPTVDALYQDIRQRALPDEATKPGDELLLVDYENVAEEIEELYEAAASAQPGFAGLWAACRTVWLMH